MPTYINNTTAQATLSGPRGERFIVDPGDTIAVPFYVSDANFTKTLDTPLSSAATATTSVTLAETAADHDLHADTRRFMVTQITGTITVWPQLDTAVPLLLAWSSEDPIIQFLLDDFPCEKLRVSGSGTATIMEYNY